MLPDPLHPAIVHFPVVLAVLVPLFAVAAAWAIRRGRMPRRLWAGVAVVQLLLLGSAWVALETGQAQEETVERVVAERHIEAHEEAAERFLWLAGAATVVVVAGLLGGPRGEIARWAACAATAATLVAVVPVGHSGGELVYRHGAASAYASTAADALPATTARHDDDD